ncbi:MAG TPA: hypothetical protein VN154_07375 [Rhizomicrobium sp.]|nr:hypothetical protein [Rhizomicrobium sp.]
MAIDGSWKVAVKTPMGNQNGVLDLQSAGGAVTGKITVGPLGSSTIEDGKVSGDNVTFISKITVPMAMTLEYNLTVTGNEIKGDIKAGAFGTMALTGARA